MHSNYPPLPDDEALAQYHTRQRRGRKAQTPEGQVLHAICEYLMLKGILWFRMNAGQRVIEGINGKRRMIRMQGAGTADILAFLPWQKNEGVIPLPVWIEVKAPGKLNNVSAAQEAFARMVVDHGHIHCVADSVDAVIKLFEWK